MKIVIIGGTGLIGSKVVEKLKRRGHEAIAAAPSTGVNTITGEGLAEALAGAQVVVDVANSPSFEDQVAMDFFQTAGKNLTAAEAAAGVKHHVALSVVGTERLQESGYFRAKLAQESLIKSSPIPYTLIRATHTFHIDEIVGRVLEYDKDPRTVVVGPQALYFGLKLNDQSLVPGPNPRLGATKFDWWLTHVPPPQKK